MPHPFAFYAEGWSAQTSTCNPRHKKNLGAIFPPLQRTQEWGTLIVVLSGHSRKVGHPSRVIAHVVAHKAYMSRDFDGRCDGDCFRSCGRAQKLPSFTKFFELAAFGRVPRIEPQVFAGAGFDGYDVPEVARNEISGDDIYVPGRELDRLPAHACVGVDGESVMHLVIGGADLHAPEAGTVVEDEVVTLTIAPGLGDGEALGNGAAHEGEFACFASALGRA